MPPVSGRAADSSVGGASATGIAVTVPERLAAETLNIPLRKYGRPEEVALAVEVLSSAFSDHMTGVNLPYDGGVTRAYYQERAACQRANAMRSKEADAANSTRSFSRN